MKTLKNTQLVTQEQKDMIQSHAYLQDPENAFVITFERSLIPAIPFDGPDITVIEMTAELDAMGWICIGEIFNATKKLSVVE